MWLIGAHALLSAYQIAYPFAGPLFVADADARERYDRVYIVVVTLIQSHWLLFGNECVLTVFEKQALDAGYRAGRCPRVTFGSGMPWLRAGLGVIPLLLLWVVLRGRLDAPTKAALVAWIVGVNAWSRVWHPRWHLPSPADREYCERLAGAVREWMSTRL
jgi:hypothetical protein